MIAEVPMVCGLCGEQFITRAFNGRVVKVVVCPKCGSTFTGEAQGEELFYD
jgi:predicted RNA-binding Zn-ribbon protein involved in translation (DUF1610 family)